MEHSHQEIEYEIAYASLQTESVDRLEQVNSIQIQFLRLFECHVASPETHPQLIYHIRNMIFAIEDIYSGTQEYFKQMHMDFVYALFRKMQVLMVNGYNFLAQALMSHIKQSQIDREIKTDLRNREEMLIKISQMGKNQPDKARALEKCDFTITFLELEEQKLKDQMHKIQDHLMLSKDLIEKIQPSKAVKELTEIKERSEITLENSERIFQQTYQLKYLQFKNYLATLQRPEDLTKEFCENIKKSIKDKFTEGMKKSVNIVYQSVKSHDRENMVDVEVQTEQPEKEKMQKKVHLKHGEKMQNLLVKERKMNEKLQLDNGTLKKEIQQWKAERYKLNQKVIELTHKNAEITNNYDILTKLYEERREENAKLVEDMGKQNSCIYQLKNIEAKYLSANPQKEISVQVNLLPSQRDQVCDVRLLDQNQTLMVLRRHNERLKQKIANMELKELKSKRVLKANIKTDCFMNYVSLQKESSSNVIHQLHTVSHDHGRKRSSIEDVTSVKVISQIRGTPGQSTLLVNLQGVKEEEKQQRVERMQKKTTKFSPQEDHYETVVNNKQEVNKSLRSPTLTKKLTKIMPKQGAVELKTTKMQKPPSLVDAETQTIELTSEKHANRAESKVPKRQIKELESILPFNRGTRMNKTLKYTGLSEDPRDPLAKRTESFTIISTNDHVRGKSRFKNTREMDSEDEAGVLYETSSKMTRQHFEQLNIQCEQSKNLQKRSILGKNNQFLISSFKNRTEDPHDLKITTCGEDVFSSCLRQKQNQGGSNHNQRRKGRKKSQTNIMIAVDRVDLKTSADLKKDGKSQKKKLTVQIGRGWSPAAQNDEPLF